MSKFTKPRAMRMKPISMKKANGASTMHARGAARHGGKNNNIVNGRSSARMRPQGRINRTMGGVNRLFSPITTGTVFLQQLDQFTLPVIGIASLLGEKFGKPFAAIARGMKWPGKKLNSFTLGDIAEKMNAGGFFSKLLSGENKVVQNLQKAGSFENAGVVDKVFARGAAKAKNRFEEAIGRTSSSLQKIANTDGLPEGATGIIEEMQGILNAGMNSGNAEKFGAAGEKLYGVLENTQHSATGDVNKVMKNASTAVTASSRVGKNTLKKYLADMPDRLKGMSAGEALAKTANVVYKANQVYRISSGSMSALHSLKMICADANNIDVSKLSMWGGFKLGLKAIFNPGKSVIAKNARKHFFFRAMPKVLTEFIPLLVMNLSGRFMKNPTEAKQMAAGMVSNMVSQGSMEFIGSRSDMLSLYQVINDSQAMGQEVDYKVYAAFIDATMPKGRARPENAIGWAAAHYAKHGTDIAQIMSDIETGKITEIANAAYNEVHSGGGAAAAEPTAHAETATNVADGQYTKKMKNEGRGAGYSALDAVLSRRQSSESSAVAL